MYYSVTGQCVVSCNFQNVLCGVFVNIYVYWGPLKTGFTVEVDLNT